MRSEATHTTYQGVGRGAGGRGPARGALRSDAARGLAYGLLAVALWSGSFVLTRLGVTTTLNAYDITALRFGTAGLLLLPVVWREGLALDRLRWPGLALLVAGTGAPYALLIAVGLLFAPASHAAALIPGPMSVMAAILGTMIVPNERMPPRRWAGAGLILLGSLAVGGLASGPSGGAGHGVGHALFLAAALLWAGYVVVLRRAGLRPLHATAIVAVGSAVLYLPLYALALPVGLGGATPAEIALQAVYQGFLTTIVGLAAFNRAVGLLGVAGGAAMPALVPVATLGLAALVLGELPGGADVAAALLIGAGVLLVTLVRSTKPDREARR